MSPGDIVLIRLPIFGGSGAKYRPALLLAQLPGPYQNQLVAGISTKLQNLQPGWDEVLDVTDPDFAQTGLHAKSAIRLSYLYAADTSQISGVIGSLSQARHRRLLESLANHLLK